MSGPPKTDTRRERVYGINRGPEEGSDCLFCQGAEFEVCGKDGGAGPPWKTLGRFPLSPKPAAAAGLTGSHSAGKRLRIADLAGLGIEPHQEFVSQSNMDHLLGFSRRVQSAVEGGEVGIVAAHHGGHHEQDGADVAAAATHRAFALVIAAVASQGRQTGEFGDGFVGQGADLRHLGHEPGDGAVGYALNGTESLVQLLPRRIGSDELGNGGFQSADLGGQQCQDGGEGVQHLRVGDQKTLIALRGLQFGGLAQTGDQSLTALRLLGRLGDPVSKEHAVSELVPCSSVLTIQFKRVC